ncbi:hypothetical protein ACFQ3Z_46200 [Streptomyces nogalater]
MFNGLGEAFGVEPGGFSVSAGFVDALTAVGDDERNERPSSGDHSEGQFHQVEECLGIELPGVADLLVPQQVHQAVEDAAGRQDRGREGDGQGPADLP